MREQGTLALLFVFYFPRRCRRAARLAAALALHVKTREKNKEIACTTLFKPGPPRRQQTSKKDRIDVGSKAVDEACKRLIAEFLSQRQFHLAAPERAFDRESGTPCSTSIDAKCRREVSGWTRSLERTSFWTLLNRMKISPSAKLIDIVVQFEPKFDSNTVDAFPCFLFLVLYVVTYTLVCIFRLRVCVFLRHLSCLANLFCQKVLSRSQKSIVALTSFTLFKMVSSICIKFCKMRVFNR